MSAFLRGFARGYILAHSAAGFALAAVALAALMLIAIVLLGTCTRAASAEPDVLGSETSRTLEYLSQSVHLGIVDGPDEPFIPDAMRRDALFVLPCENRSLDPTAVSATADAGIWQLNPVHEKRATRLGFTWGQMLEPGPNTIVARSIWEDSRSFAPWSCRTAIR